jgi:hypothetical protein
MPSLWHGGGGVHLRRKGSNRIIVNRRKNRDESEAREKKRGRI